MTPPAGAPHDDAGAADPAAAWLSTLVFEALDKVASPDARNVLIRAALDRASLERLPGHPQELLDFAVGPLRDAVAEGLGEEAGEALVQDLEPILQHAAAAAGPAPEPEPEPAVEPEPESAVEAAEEGLFELAEEPRAGEVGAEPAPDDLAFELADEPAEEQPAPEPEPQPAVEAPDGGPFELVEEPAATKPAAEPAAEPRVLQVPAAAGAAPARRRNTMPLRAQREREAEPAAGAQQPVQRAAAAAGGALPRRMRSTFDYQEALLLEPDKRFAVVLDDERAFLRGYSSALRARNFEVFTAVGASDVVALCRRVEPDLVLVDGAMPELSHEQLLADLHETVDPAVTMVAFLWNELPAHPPESAFARSIAKPAEPDAALDALGIVRPDGGTATE